MVMLYEEIKRQYAKSHNVISNACKKLMKKSISINQKKYKYPHILRIPVYYFLTPIFAFSN